MFKNNLKVFFLVEAICIFYFVWQVDSIESIIKRVIVGAFYGSSVGLLVFLDNVSDDRILRAFIVIFLFWGSSLFYIFANLTNFTSVAIMFFISIALYFILDRKHWPKDE